MNAFDVFLSVAAVIVGSGYLILCAYNHENPFLTVWSKKKTSMKSSSAVRGGRRILF